MIATQTFTPMINISQTNSKSQRSRSERTGSSKTTWFEASGRLWVLGMLVLVLQATPSLSFQQQRQAARRSFSVLPTITPKSEGYQQNSLRLLASPSNNNAPKPYVAIRESQPLGKTKKALVPQIGDVVRYYDLDGGKEKGQLLVGKISYVFGSKEFGGFSVELYELEDVGDGYFAEYASALRSRKGRKTERRLEEVSPIAASFVNPEQAYKVPIDAISKLPKPRQETYDIDDYEGPSFYASVDVNVVETDAENYATLKAKLFRDVLLTGLVGTIVTNASYGAELATIYFAGLLVGESLIPVLASRQDGHGRRQQRG